MGSRSDVIQRTKDGFSRPGFDTRVQRPKDSRFRDVYTTTIALRNRLGNY